MGLSAVPSVPGTTVRRRLDRRSGTLLGSGCPECGATSWPARAICHRCGTPMDLEMPLSSRGVLLAFTQVWVPRPNLETPYTLGQIEIGDALFFGHVRGLPPDTRVPMDVALVIPPEREGILDFWFEPAAESG